MRTIIIYTLLFFSTAISHAQSDNAGTMEFDGSYRLRFETLDSTFRASQNGGDQILVSRLLFSAKASVGFWRGELELQDSRSWFDDSGTPLGTDDVNTAEPLQAYIGWKNTRGSSEIAVKAGRFTMNVGSRRFVARNGFRNTLNAFSGIFAESKTDDWLLQTFYTLPVQRRPVSRSQLDRNEQEFDHSYSDIQFWGLYGGRGASGDANGFDVYVFGVNEEDQPDLSTRNRDYLTMGSRVFSKSEVGRWDYEVEAAYQFGDARGSTAPGDVTDLDHEAYFIHAQLGRQTDDNFNSRWEFQFDYASGDKNPNDNQSNRFDTLFGARRFEFGPTGIYGALARSNILSPSVRWEFKFENNNDGFVGYRAVWLAQKRDAMTTSSVRDASGNTDDFVGHQLETRLRINLSNELRTEIGAAYLIKGGFLKDAPNAPNTGDTSYLYGSISYVF